LFFHVADRGPNLLELYSVFTPDRIKYMGFNEIRKGEKRSAFVRKGNDGWKKTATIFLEWITLPGYP